MVLQDLGGRGVYCVGCVMLAANRQTTNSRLLAHNASHLCLVVPRTKDK